MKLNFSSQAPTQTPSATAGTRRRGFTLIELLVVIAIIGIVSAVMLFNYRSYDYNTSLQNIAQDIDLTFRQAQIYATSVRGYTPTSGPTSGKENFTTAYGVYISTAPGSNNKYVIFADPTTGNDPVTGAPLYDPNFCTYSGQGVCTPQFTVIEGHLLNPNFTISTIYGGQGDSCDDPSILTLTDLSFVYTKTGLGPTIYGSRKNGTIAVGPLTYAEIHVLSPNGALKRIVVKSNGSSYITDTSTCPN